MSFHTRWHELLERIRDLPEETRLRTPRTGVLFTIDAIQEHRIIVRYERRGETEPLEKAQFETLYRRLTDSDGGYELRRLPPEAAPYPTVLSLHPQINIATDCGVIAETDSPSTSPVRGDSLELGSGSHSRTDNTEWKPIPLVVGPSDSKTVQSTHYDSSGCSTASSPALITS